MATTSQMDNDHIINPHVLFGTEWQKLTPEAQAKMVEELPLIRPAPSTPPRSPATPMAEGGSGPSGPLGSVKTAGGMRPSPYASRIKAELQAQQLEGRFCNQHLSFSTHPVYQHTPSENPAEMSWDRLAARAAHQADQDTDME